MGVDSTDAYGKPAFNDAFSLPGDLSAAVAYTDTFAYIRQGTSTERQSLPAGKQRPGMLWTETDTGMVWRTDGAGVWSVVSSPDTGWKAVTFTNSWVNAAGGEEVEYRRMGGVVYLKGRAALGSTGTAFTLPAGFRPKSIIRSSVFSNVGSGGTTGLTINTNGTVVLASGSQPQFADISPFPADQ